MAVRVGIMGATGYSALELLRYLLRHPEVEISVLTSRQEGNPHIAAVHPSLAGRLDLCCENLEPEAVAARSDVVFCCLPHGVTAQVVPRLLEAGTRVVDLSADFRLKNAEVYRQWYGKEHQAPELLSQAVYGLPELYREQIRSCRLVANPGCYPTSAILALAPLLRAGVIEPRGIIVDSKSGVSGAGRQPKLTTLYPECNESLSAYNVGRHRHTPEIEQVLGEAAGADVEVIFTPHLAPMDRGILSTVYAVPQREVGEEELLELFADFYRREPFVRVVEHLPATKDTAGSNFCDLTVRVVRGRVLMLSCLDNLGKGAAGAAVQNMNLLLGLEETTALL